MSKLLYIIILSFLSFNGISQKTLLVEKIGKPAKYYYHSGDKIKLKALGVKSTLKGTIGAIGDSSFILKETFSDTIVRLKDIQCVYKQRSFPKKFGIRLCEFGGVIFAVMVFNNLVNDSPAFNQYVFIVSGSFVGAGLISLAFSERPCKIGSKWKVKIMDGYLK
jgi:hypothetical protein